MSVKRRIGKLEAEIGIGPECKGCGYPVPSGKEEILIFDEPPGGFIAPGRNNETEKSRRLKIDQQLNAVCGECGRLHGAPCTVLIFRVRD